jgi:hypothetical protein
MERDWYGVTDEAWLVVRDVLHKSSENFQSLKGFESHFSHA